jgi:hypothetical protein
MKDNLGSYGGEDVTPGLLGMWSCGLLPTLWRSSSSLFNDAFSAT